MQKFVAASLLLLLLFSSNIWSLELCRAALSKVADCCRDGFCPHHNHIESAQDTNGNDCVCKISPNDHALLILSLSGPAIISQSLASPMIRIMRFAELVTFSAASYDQPTLTPPPKA